MTDLPRALAGRPWLVLDGGLATELAEQGHDLRHPLWSARVLVEAPRAIVQVHEAYLRAGADVITTATYQASVQGLVAVGLSSAQALALLSEATAMACRVRDRVAPHALVAASVGSYGATLADGSEYRGDWDPHFDLAGFHAPRLAAVAPGADLVACETIPSLAEALALARCLAGPAWISFSLRDGAHTAAGDELTECARALSRWPHVVAIGINCCAPSLVAEALTRLAAGTELPLVAYPNSGQTWGDHRWCGNAIDPAAFVEQARTWPGLGARVIGGCCRTGPAHVAALVARRAATM